MNVRCCGWGMAVILVALIGSSSAEPIDVTNYGGHTYCLLGENSWTEAELEAISLGGHLVTVNDLAEHQFLWNRWGRDSLLWIGLTDAANEGTFRWIGGSPSTFMYWASGEPSSFPGDEDYVHMWSSHFNSEGRWNDNQNLVDEKPQRAIMEIDSITVRVATADVAADHIAVLLGGTDATGQLAVEVIPARGKPHITSADVRGAGLHHFSYDLPSLDQGQYTRVRATWTVGGGQHVHTEDSTFYVMGDYRHSQYNTVEEIQCPDAPLGPALFWNPNPSCTSTSATLRQRFIDEVHENGSGIAIVQDAIQWEQFCNPRPRLPNWFRDIAAITGSCPVENYLGEFTVAMPPDHPLLRCGDDILIVGLGEWPGTIKRVTDTCPECGSRGRNRQLDNFTTNPACSDILDIGRFRTIRLR